MSPFTTWTLAITFGAVLISEISGFEPPFPILNENNLKTIEKTQVQAKALQNAIRHLVLFPTAPEKEDHLRDVVFVDANYEGEEDFASISMSRYGIQTEHFNLTQCQLDFIYAVTQIVEKPLGWPTKMVDSFGKIPAGILKGAVNWPGDFYQCVDVVGDEFSTHYPDNNTLVTVGNFVGKYCKIHIKVPESPSQMFEFNAAVCIPSTCTMDELLRNASYVDYLLNRFPILQNLSKLVYYDESECILKSDNRELDTSSIILLVVIGILLVLVVVGTLYDLKDAIIGFILPPPPKDLIPSYSVNNSSELSFPTSKSEAKTSNIEHPDEQRTPPGGLGRFLLCFSFASNASKILNTDAPQGPLSNLHGIRFLSMSWVILGHTYAFLMVSMPLVANVSDVMTDIRSWQFMGIMQGTFSVDSFFVLSGFLVTYLFLKEVDKNDGRITIFQLVYYYIHRLWRLSPAYFLALWFYASLFVHLGQGPFWNNSYDKEFCKDKWWMNIIYGNNFAENGTTCMSWSWYLANDMQFYVISPVFLVFLHRWKHIGLTIMSAILIASWIANGVITKQNDLRVMFIEFINYEPGDPEFDDIERKTGQAFDEIYIKPYTRIATYIIGCFTGYLIFVLKGKKRFLAWWQTLIGWLVAAVVALSVVYGVYKVKMSTDVTALYMSLGRSAWAAALCWVIFACSTGHGGFVNTLLSHPFFIPLGRLTYCAYLLHPILMFIVYLNSTRTIYFAHTTMVFFYIAFLVLSYLFSLLYSCIVESPMMNLEKLLLKKRS